LLDNSYSDEGVNELFQSSSTGGVHQNMRGVNHYERVHKGASPTCHTKQIFCKLPVIKNEQLTNQ